MSSWLKRLTSRESRRSTATCARSRALPAAERTAYLARAEEIANAAEAAAAGAPPPPGAQAKKAKSKSRHSSKIWAAKAERGEEVSILVCGWREKWKNDPRSLRDRIDELAQQLTPGPAKVIFMNVVRPDEFAELMARCGFERAYAFGDGAGLAANAAAAMDEFVSARRLEPNRVWVLRPAAGELAPCAAYAARRGREPERRAAHEAVVVVADLAVDGDVVEQLDLEQRGRLAAGAVEREREDRAAVLVVVGPAHEAEAVTRDGRDRRAGRERPQVELLALGLGAHERVLDARAVGGRRALEDAAAPVESQPQPRARDIDAELRDAPARPRTSRESARARAATAAARK